ncbi:glycoside hydrolase family 13 protein [Cohnella sp. AR92]|uniref:glycoside hydrolase family 13 protein n=1 Tax=Cohnella sp. AR92 TaxID=648716 RepID=UPI000F8F6F46|nr:glycoside hydrolase family 13 protein [Cohnella sp. AR92]RUS46705.1 glycoside hydrolase family 13 protein [Cohnella sp. AR92]
MDGIFITHYDTREYISPIDRNSLHVKVKCAAAADCSVSIVYWNKFRNEFKEGRLESLSLGGPSEFYSTTLAFDEPAKYLSYYFVIRHGDDRFYYSPYGLADQLPAKHFEYPSTNVDDVFTVPAWAEGSVGYQIFPERFGNGDAGNDPPNVAKWNDPPTRDNFMGGDLRGIIERFSHLRDLGIDIIYLTPIFCSPSNHKYDTTDYFKIDPSFGDTEDLKELVALCHSHGVKLVLDGVFHHIGYYSYQFQDAILNGKDSPYWSWFFIQGDTVDTKAVNYECVGYYKWMPRLNFSNPDVRTFFLSVGEHWIREAGIDGWRLDVADEVDFTFWQEFRRRIKGIDSNLLLIGETWKNGADLLRGDQMDTIMNYRFRDAVIDFFANKSIGRAAFARRIESMLFDYPLASRNVLYNLLGSHDTARFLTVCKENIDTFKLAIVFQMTFPGMPFVYYGDEIGMTGETDPLCRKAMAWDSANAMISEFYKNIIRIRHGSNALRYGDFKHIDTASELYGFIRTYEDETIIVLLNNDQEDCLITGEWLNERASVSVPDSDTVEIPANSYEILSLIREGEGHAVRRMAIELKEQPERQFKNRS